MSRVRAKKRAVRVVAARGNPAAYQGADSGRDSTVGGTREESRTVSVRGEGRGVEESCRAMVGTVEGRGRAGEGRRSERLIKDAQR